MKKLLILFFTVLNLPTFGQDKYNYVHFNKLTQVSGTEFVIASIENMSKLYETKSQYLLFINTKTGQTNQVDFPKDANIRNLKQVKLDSLNLNLIVIEARTVDLDRKNGIDWNDPSQIIILSPDGKEKTQLTDSKFFTRTWAVNKLTGIIVITGHYDTNNNNKYDKTDKNEIQLFDLRTRKQVYKL